MRSHPGRLVVSIAFLVCVLPSATRAQDAKLTPEAVQFFESKIRPILVENCCKCHADKKQRGDLRVDGRSHLLAGGEIGPAIVLGEPEKSLLIKAVRHEEPDLKMPPDNKLSKEKIADLAMWIKMGAPWPGDEKTPVAKKKSGEKEITPKDREFWSFVPVKRPAVPQVRQSEWAKNPIDAFVLSKLEAKGLKPNPPASKQELVRRAYYNVTGLPPTPAEAEAFVKDNAPDAYAKLIDKLLDSPRFGEKWARHWLDQVRYAETNSYERDNPKPHVWRYRDYVVRSFNEDKPYDVFLKEQLAGDEMANAGPDQLIATGFYRLGIWDDEPSDPLQSRYDGLDDILTTVSQTMLGLTLDCARCHDHKIDPIQHKDYYRFLAFFQNINHYRNGGPTDEAAIFANENAKAELARKIAQMEKRRDEVQRQILLIEKEFESAKGNKGTPVSSKASIDELKFRFYRGAWQTLPEFDAIKHEDEGILPQGYFDISLRTRNEEIGFVFEGTLLVPEDGKYAFHLDSDDGSRLIVNGKKLIEYDGIHGVGKEKTASIRLAAGRVPIRLEYFQNVSGYGLFAAWSGPGFERRPLTAPPTVKNASGDFVGGLKKEGPIVLGKAKFEEYQRLKKELETLKNPEIKAAGEKALIVSEPGQKTPEAFVFLRGNPTSKGPKVEPGIPEVLTLASLKLPDLSPTPKSSGRRTQLAAWIASKENPLTARVMANRLWQNQFGRGIVRSTSNFGTQGDRPTHPELLDWLASEFVEHGWSVKKMLKTMMLSNTFQMSSRVNEEAIKADPTNDLLWRFDMRRLSAEEIRDSILAVSGNLNLKMHGPPTYPEIPKEVLAGQSVPGRGWPTSSTEEQNRRSIYVHVKRSLLLPVLEAFDLAEADRPTATRFASTQPTQALLLLNSEFAQRQADALAARLRKDAGEKLEDQVRHGLNLTTQRTPTDAEVRKAMDLIKGLRDDGVSPEASIRYFCLMALNLNEFVYLD
ncbi:MAG: DUF1553 domain-containing protein [Gemmataceae bacterium]|nr:DUF1553 domain-containing protein [Gemmataceae bacterium]